MQNGVTHSGGTSLQGRGGAGGDGMGGGGEGAGGDGTGGGGDGEGGEGVGGGGEGVGGGGDGCGCAAGGEAATLPVRSTGSVMLPTLLLPVNVSVSAARYTVAASRNSKLILSPCVFA